MSKKNDKPSENASSNTEGKSQSPSPAQNQSSSTPKSRRIMLFGRMENDVCLPAVKRLLRLNQLDPTKPIDLYINSSGGNGYNADAVIAVINQISAPVNTICLGHALSGACEILASGTGKRTAYEFATLMFHQTLWEADGDITNLEIQAKQGQKFREAQIELLHRCTGQEKKRLRSDIERDFYLSASEALAYGLIDEIIYHNAKNRREKNGKSKGELSAAAFARIASDRANEVTEEVPVRKAKAAKSKSDTKDNAGNRPKKKPTK